VGTSGVKDDRKLDETTDITTTTYDKAVIENSNNEGNENATDLEIEE